MRFRKIKKADYPAVREMMLRFSSENEQGNPVSNQTIKKTLKEFERHPDKGCVFVFKDRKEFVGYAIIVQYWSNENGGNIPVIDELYVDAANRNKGTASAFIRYLIERKFNHAVAFGLEVYDSNQVKNLYQRLGFRPQRFTFYLYEYPLKGQQPDHPGT